MQLYARVARVQREMPDVAVKIVLSSRTIVGTFSMLPYAGMVDGERQGRGLRTLRWADRSVVAAMAAVVGDGQRRTGASLMIDITPASDKSGCVGELYVLQ